MCSEMNVYVYCLNGPALTDFHNNEYMTVSMRCLW